jgi:hypothetical protein
MDDADGMGFNGFVACFLWSGDSRGNAVYPRDIFKGWIVAFLQSSS